MKTPKKALTQSIAVAIESKLSASIDLTKKEKKAIEKSAKKLAKKVGKHLDKAEKKALSSDKQAV